MKWIGQHIWDLISRFRGKVYIENLEGSNSTTALVIDPDGQLKTNSLGSGGNGEAAKVRLPVRFDEANGVSKGDPVYIKSYHGSVGPVIVAKADASSSAHMPAFGLADADYAHNADGYAISIGNLVDLDTSSYSVGDTLYVAVGGGLTNVKPITEANLIQNVGTVARSNANNGQVEVVATGRSNDVPNLNSGNVFVGDVSNQATQQSLSSAITDVGDVTLSGDLAIGNDSDITCVGNMSFIVDSDDNESLQKFTWKHGGGSDVANIDESGTFNLYGVDLGEPRIRLDQSNQTANHGPPVFEFVRNAANSDLAIIGITDFIARNNTGTLKYYARISGSIEENNVGYEGGKLNLQVASHDGELQSGLVIKDGRQEDEVDATIGNGIGSIVSVPGSLSVNGGIKISVSPATSNGDIGTGGDIIYIGSGTTVAGYIYYLNSSNNWIAAHPSTTSTALGLLAVALGSSPSIDGMLLRGAVTISNLGSSPQIGNVAYLGGSQYFAGVGDVVAPSSSGNVVRVIGYSLTTASTSSRIWFNPSDDWVVVT